MTINRVSILSSKDNGLLRRREFKLEVEYSGGQPSRAELLERISEELKISTDRLVIVKALSNFGRNVSTVEARVYESKELLLETEPKHVLIRNGYLEKK